MEPYTTETESKFKLNASDDWLRHRQGVALPILPPTTLDARKYFFSQIRKFAALASSSGRKKIDFESFARDWNGSADGKTRYYVTADVLSTYAKTWEKISNIRASQDLISAKIDLVRQTGELFSASTLPFPESLKGNPLVVQPQRGVVAFDDNQEIPDSISVGLAISHPRITSDKNKTAVRPAVQGTLEAIRSDSHWRVSSTTPGGATTSRDLQIHNGESEPPHEAGTYGEDPATSITRLLCYFSQHIIYFNVVFDSDLQNPNANMADFNPPAASSLHFDGPSADLDRGRLRLAEVGRGGSTGLVEGKLAEVG
jgi:hypothetical protein